MNLELGIGEQVANPTALEISRQLARLDGGDDAYAILSQSPMTYLQTSGGQTSGFVVEYQVDSLAKHFNSTRDDLPLATVDAMFRAYAAGDDSWKSMVQWEDSGLGASGSPAFSAPLVGVGLVAVALLFGLAWWWRAG